MVRMTKCSARSTAISRSTILSRSGRAAERQLELVAAGRERPRRRRRRRRARATRRSAGSGTSAVPSLPGRARIASCGRSSAASVPGAGARGCRTRSAPSAGAGRSAGGGRSPAGLAGRARAPSSHAGDGRRLARVPAAMPVPDVLRKLLTAPGPSGYEQAAAAVFRDAAAAFAEVTHDTVGSTVARVKGTGDGPLLAVVGHIDEIGLIVHHIDDDGFLWFTRRRRLGPGHPRRPAGRGRHARRRRARRGRQEADPPAEGGGAQEGPRAARPAHRHRRARRRRARAPRPHRRRRGDRRRAGRVPERARRLALDGQPAGLLRRLEVARLVAEAGGAPGDVAARRGHAGGDHLRAARARPPTRSARTSRSSST